MTEQNRWVAYYVKDPSKPKPDGAVRIMCLSDTHGQHSKIPSKFIFPADIAVHAGDFTNVGKREDVISFREWYKQLPTQYKLLIAGNHDISFDEEMYQYKYYYKCRGYKEPPELSKKEIICPEIIYAEETTVNLMGIKFYCSPRSPFIDGWCFPTELKNKGKEWNDIDNTFDVVVTHSPPSGVFDFDIKDLAFGDPYLALKIQDCRTPLHIFGHSHCCNGFYRHGMTLYVNCSVLDIKYRYYAPPIYIDMIKSGEVFDEPDYFFPLEKLIKMSLFRNPLFYDGEEEESEEIL